MKCLFCGFEDEGKFCSNCGRPLHDALPAETDEQINHDNRKWQACISFGKSTSPNFARALTMAKAAPQFIESVDEHGNTVYQAIYDAENYLQFIALYELISNWKSCFVFINNKMVDRKIISNLNYCYGDKIRSGNPRFCFGASEWTENPFGCHRAQMHRGKDPWYSFGYLDASGKFHVDIEKIIDELCIRLEPYKFCPSLNMKEVISRAKNLPRIINPRKDPEWEYTTYCLADGSYVRGVIPKKYISRYEIAFSLNTENKDGIIEKKQSKTHVMTEKTGCLLLALVLICIVTFITLV